MSGLTEKELEVRRHRLTASTTPAYLGYSPYESPMDAWLVDAGLSERKTNDAMDSGNRIEEAVAGMVERDLGLVLYRPTSIFHPAYPEAIVVHPDRLGVDAPIGVQIKNHEAHLARAGEGPGAYKGRPCNDGRLDNELVPLHILLQCQFEMLVVAARRWATMPHPEPGAWSTWILAAYFGGARPRYYRIRRDLRMQDGMLRAGLAFWRKHLDPAGPRIPPTDAAWHVLGATPLARRPRRKLSDAELMAAPLPFGTNDQERLDWALPFSGEKLQ